MRTGAEGYAEVQAMKPVNVLAVMEADGRAVALAIDESKSQHREQSWTRHLKEHDKAVSAVADLITACRLYYAAGVRCSMESSPEATESLMLSAVAIFKAMDRIA